MKFQVMDTAHQRVHRAEVELDQRRAVRQESDKERRAAHKKYQTALRESAKFDRETIRPASKTNHF